MKVQKNEKAINIFYILSFLCINICEFIKNIYWLYIIGVIALLFFSGTRRKINKHELLICIAALMMAMMSIFNNPKELIYSNNELKFLIFIIIILLGVFSNKSIEDGFKYEALIGFIHVIATYFFFFFRSAYYVFNSLFYGYFPVGTNSGTLGYTAALTSHFSANALYLTGCITALIGLWFKNKRDKKIIFAIIVAMGALLLTGKRGHIFFLAISCYIMMCLIYKKHIRKILKTTFLAVCILVLLFALLSIIMPEMLSVLNRLRDGDSGRFKYWTQAFEWFKEKPILGIGWLQFSEQYKVFNWGKSMNAHNVYIQVLTECGIVGFAFYMMMVLLILKETVLKFTITFRKKSDIAYILFYSMIVQVFYLLYSFTGNCLYDNTFFFYSMSAFIALKVPRKPAMKS